MILVFGSILMNIQLTLEKEAPRPNTHYAKDYDLGVGGKAALQALAVVKAGSKTGEKAALIGQIGDDHYGKNVLLRLRQNGVLTSGVARHENIPTGSAIQIGKQPGQFIIALGASNKANHEQIPEDILNEKATLLIQDEFPAEKNIPLIEKAQRNQACIILNCGINNDFQDYDLTQINYVIIDENNRPHINWVKKKAPSKLITLKAQGACTAQTAAGQPIEIKAPIIEDREWIDPTCTEDAFCGTFAASINTGLPLEKALLRAAVASTLTASKKGGYRTIPYPDEIRDSFKEALKDIE